MDQRTKQVLLEAKKRGLTDGLRDWEKAPEWFHEGQLQAWDAKTTGIVITAGAQSGKTAMMPYWLAREIHQCKDLIKELGRGDFLYLGPTLTLLDAQAIPKFIQLFQDEWKLGKMNYSTKPKFVFSAAGSRKILGFSAPLTVHFAYANDPNNLESLTALGAVWDECGQAENKEASYEALQRRLSVARSKGKGRILFGTTPYEWGWFKRRVYDVAKNFAEDYACFNFPTWMNPLQSREAIEKYLLEGMPKWKWEMMYLGLFTKPAGMIYDCWDHQENTCDRFDIPQDWKIYTGHDFGQVNTACVFLAHDPDNDIFYLFATYHRGGLSGVEHAQNLVSFFGKPQWAVGGAKSEDEWRREYSRGGLYVQKPPIGDVELGIDRVYRLIKQRKLVVFRDLTNIIGEISTYSRKLNDSGEIQGKDIENKNAYHRLDALRYICSYLVNDSGQIVVSRFQNYEEERGPKYIRGRYARKQTPYSPPPEPRSFEECVKD